MAHTDAIQPAYPTFARYWRQQFAQFAAEWRIIRWLAPVVFLHSLIYVFLVPPWQHYDEPGHFLYAAYIVRGGISAPDNLMIAREVADSMYRHQFWSPGVQPDLLSPLPPSIPTDQRHHPPLYYVLMAKVIGPLRYLPVEIQLYAGRLVSALLMTLTVLAVWRTVRIIIPDKPQLALVLAALVAITPAFADLMSAFNSDVLMNFAAAAAFLGMAILLRKNWHLTGWTLALLGATVAIFTKRTAFPIVALLVLTLLWVVYQRPIRWWMYILIGSIVAGMVAASSFTFTPEGWQTRPWLAAIERNYLRIRLIPWLMSWADWERGWPWYQRTLEVAHNHFWVRLAWGHIPVWPPVGDWLFASLSIAAIIGLVRGAFTWPAILPLWQQRWMWLCLLAVVVAWIALFSRLHPLSPDSRPHIPRGRYLYWAMVPTIWLLVMGWQQLWPERWRPYMLYALLALFAVFDLAAIIALFTFYYLH